MPKKKTRAELEAELRLLKSQRAAAAWASVLNSLIKWTGATAIAYCGYLSIDTLAGKTTAADIGVELLANIRLSEVFAYLFGVGAVGYGLAQRQLRRSTVERLQGRVRTLEQVRDSGRTSSGLTPRGDTHPKDK